MPKEVPKELFIEISQVLPKKKVKSEVESCARKNYIGMYGMQTA